MIRKGLPPGIRPAFNRPDGRSGFRTVLPFRRPWKIIALLAALDAVFLIPGINAVQEAVSLWGRQDDLFDMVSALFMSAWVLGWSIGPLAMTGILLLLLFGREVIKARSGTVELYIGLPSASRHRY